MSQQWATSRRLIAFSNPKSAIQIPKCEDPQSKIQNVEIRNQKFLRGH
jgi:hypothetical protein